MLVLPAPMKPVSATICGGEIGRPAWGSVDTDGRKAAGRPEKRRARTGYCQGILAPALLAQWRRFLLSHAEVVPCLRRKGGCYDAGLGLLCPACNSYRLAKSDKRRFSIWLWRWRSASMPRSSNSKPWHRADREGHGRGAPFLAVVLRSVRNRASRSPNVCPSDASARFSP